MRSTARRPLLALTVLRTVAVAAIGLVIITVAAGCSTGSQSSAPSATSSTPGSNGPAGPGEGGPGGGEPGVFGLVAEVDAGTAQVQGTSGQTAVTFTAKTTVSEETTVTRSAVVVGWCATVQTANVTGSAAPTAAPSERGDPVAAISVSLRAASADGCSPQRDQAGRPSRTPSGAPSGLPSGAPSGADRMGFGATGKISSVDGAGFVITRTTDAGSEEVTVSTTAATTYTRTAKATAKAIVAGRCLSAQGGTDDTGTMAATSIMISPSTDGTCTRSGRPGAPQSGR